jgi:hypothetical protein
MLGGQTCPGFKSAADAAHLKDDKGADKGSVSWSTAQGDTQSLARIPNGSGPFQVANATEGMKND